MGYGGQAVLESGHAECGSVGVLCQVRKALAWRVTSNKERATLEFLIVLKLRASIRLIISVGSSPEEVAISPNGATAYVTNEGDNTVSVIDTESNDATGMISVGSAPFGVAVTPTGTEVYVTNVGGNTVSVIDTNTNAVTKTISGFEDPESLGVFIKP